MFKALGPDVLAPIMLGHIGPKVNAYLNANQKAKVFRNQRFPAIARQSLHRIPTALRGWIANYPMERQS